MMLGKVKVLGHLFAIVMLFCCTQTAWSSGVIAMPDTTEVPEYERDSMLLDLDIPPVRARDPDPEAGPRLNVKEFRLQGIVEYPKLGITRENISKRIEAIRFDIMKEGQHTESGFTMEELGEMSALVAEIEKTTKTQHVGVLEVQKFVFLVREQLNSRGVTLGMIETVADTITQFYRERGFILAKAYIPKQKVRDGVVNLTLLLGELGEVEIEDSKRVSTRLIKNTFNNDIHKPVANWKIDEALYLINDIPGLQAQGFFSPGGQVGDTRMTIKVLEEKWTTMNLRLDNHGSEATSENRVYADIFVHNPLGIGDELYFAVLNSYSPDASTYGSIRYNSFLGSPKFRSSIGFSTNDFVSRNVRQELSPVFTGESDVADISLSYIFKRSRVKNYSTEIKYMDIDTSLDAGVSSEPTGKSAKKVSLTFNFDILNEKRRQLYVGSVGLHNAKTVSSGGFDGTTKGNDRFLTFDISMLSFMSIPFTEVQTRVLLKSSLQYAGKSLSNLNGINLTGPSKTRGFGINGFQSDDGLYFGADWIFNLPKFGGAKLFGESINRVFQPYVFVDGAYGVVQEINEDTDEKITGRLANAGVGMKFNLWKVSGSLLYSKVVTDDVKALQDVTPVSGVYFDVQVRF